jgi:DNA-binding IclR family transcriptional regulator
MSSPIKNREESSPVEGREKTWHFLSNHTQVLLCIARDPDTRLRDIAQAVGITERAAQRIVTDLIKSGYVESERHGRRSRYTINRQIAMRHPAQTNHEIGELLDLLTRADPPGQQ